MIDKYNEACFGEYCKSCIYRKFPETEYPCNECLAEPVNVFSCKPIRYKAGSSLFDSSQDKDRNYRRTVKYIPEKRKDGEKAIARDNIGAEGVCNKALSIDEGSTDHQYPSAKAVINAINKALELYMTDTDIISSLIETDMILTVEWGDRTFLADENNNILMW